MSKILELFNDGSFPQIIQWLLLCNVLDVVSGFIKALDTKSVSSSKMKHGAYSKLIIWLVVAVSYIASGYFNSDLTVYVCGYYIIMEMVSILENCSSFTPIPDKLKSILDTNNAKEPETKETTETTVDPEILKLIKEKENE